MKIVVAGGSGFIGRNVVHHLASRGDVVVLSRDPSRVKEGRGVAWNPPAAGDWQKEVADADVIVNLAGENIGEGRWTGERKRRLTASRLDATRALVDVLRSTPRPGRTLVSASAVGYYGAREDEILDETGSAGAGFLAELTRSWEAAARETDSAARLVILRFGIVLAADGGALPKMILPFKLLAGGPIGSGRQWMSWVDREDAVAMILWSVDNASVKGVYNVTAPEPARNRDFAAALGSVLGRPSLLPTPGFALKLALGEMAEALLLSGQRVVPKRATSEGFSFRYADLRSALEHAIR